jgi:hypothetical protein
MRVHTNSSPDVSEIGVGSTGLQHRAGCAGENEASSDGVGVVGSTPRIARVQARLELLGPSLVQRLCDQARHGNAPFWLGLQPVANH